MPAPEMFQDVQFYDISPGGCGMLLEAPSQFKNFVVVIDRPDGNLYALAEVVRMRRSTETNERGQRMWEIGCRFSGKLQSDGVTETLDALPV
jgi:hypothetical protein